MQIFDIIHVKDLDLYDLMSFQCHVCAFKPQRAIFLGNDNEGEPIYICSKCIDKLTELRQKL